MIFLLRSLVSQLAVSLHQFVLHLEIEIVIRLPVALHGNQMLLSQAMHQSDNLVFQLFHLHRAVVNQQAISSRKTDSQQILLIHHRFLSLLVLRLRRRKLAQQSLIHIHRCGDKEEYQQHERDVGC